MSLSGGEPFLYRGLDRLLHGSADLGYGINVVTNGTVLTARRLSEVARLLSFVVVSVDGPRSCTASLSRPVRGCSTCVPWRWLAGAATWGRMWR